MKVTTEIKAVQIRNIQNEQTNRTQHGVGHCPAVRHASVTQRRNPIDGVVKWPLGRDMAGHGESSCEVDGIHATDQ